MDPKIPLGQCQECSHRAVCELGRGLVREAAPLTATMDWCPDFDQDKEKKQ